MPSRSFRTAFPTVVRSIVMLACVAMGWLDAAAQTASGPPAISTLKPSYVPIAELLRLLGATERGGVYELSWDEGGHTHRVQAHPHETANAIILFGDSGDIETTRRLAAAMDAPSRQIQLEATIIEIDRAKARDAGVDWQQMLDELSPHTSISLSRSENRSGTIPLVQQQVTTQRSLNTDINVTVGDVLRVVDERRIGTVKNTPRILTLNNRSATLLDGERVTYVSRATAVANIYETQTMDAGLKLEVRPSLGDTGYLLLEIKAELTSLISAVGDNPVKSGQILENSVVMKDGETVLLGGFKRVIDRKQTRRVPVLGWVVPFLFSHTTLDQQVLDEYIVLAAHVVDFDVGLDDSKLKEMNVK